MFHLRKHPLFMHPECHQGIPLKNTTSLSTILQFIGEMYKYVIQHKKDVTTNSTAISYNRWNVPKRIKKTIQKITAWNNSLQMDN
mgnify:CR=1 FL=1